MHPDLNEIDFKHLTADVLDYHRELFADQLTYQSANMIVVDNNLGVRSDLSLGVLKILDTDLKEFRCRYKPYDHAYQITQSDTSVTIATPTSETEHTFTLEYLREIN